MSQTNIVNVYSSEIRALCNTIDHCKHVLQQHEIELNNRALDMITSIVSRFPSNVLDKYHAMSWPYDAIQHIHLLFEWIERPKIRKSLGKAFFYASNFQEQETYTPNYLTQSKFDFVEDE